MTNQQRAEAVICGMWADHDGLAIAKALADAQPPILMPDLPKPGHEGAWWPSFGPIGSVRATEEGVQIRANQLPNRWNPTKAEAEELGHILIAAATKKAETND